MIGQIQLILRGARSAGGRDPALQVGRHLWRRALSSAEAQEAHAVYRDDCVNASNNDSDDAALEVLSSSNRHPSSYWALDSSSAASAAAARAALLDDDDVALMLAGATGRLGAPAPGEAEAAAVRAQLAAAPLWGAIRRHYGLLAREMPEYAARVPLDEFGALYVAQLRREEAARHAAVEAFKEQQQRPPQPARGSGIGYGGAAADAVSSSSSSSAAAAAAAEEGPLTAVMRDWVARVEAAVAAEQRRILEQGRGHGPPDDPLARDRHRYGPFLLLIPPRDAAALAVHTVLAKVTGATPSWREDGVAERAGVARVNAASALLVADEIGRGVCERLGALRYKAEVAAAAAEQRREEEQEQLRRQQDQPQEWHWQQQFEQRGWQPHGEPPLGPRTAAEMAKYRVESAAAAAAHAEGLARLRALEERIAADSSGGGGRRRRLPLAWRERLDAAASGRSWDVYARVKVGAVLLAIVVDNTPVPVVRSRRRASSSSSSSSYSSIISSSNGPIGRRPLAPGVGAAAVPAFVHSSRRVDVGVKSKAIIEASPALLELARADAHALVGLSAQLPPMFVPPEPWSGHNEGGYLSRRMWMMRTHRSWHVEARLRECAGQYPGVLAALNALGETAWRINRPVYEAMSALYAAKSTACRLPRQDPYPPPAPPGTGYRLIRETRGAASRLVARGGEADPSELRAHRLAYDDVRRRNRNLASLHAEFRLKWRVAAELVNAPEFYYPHSLDFRGRAYPMHPNMQHLGDDVSRGLLTFARPRRLGPDGFDWLLVHFANVWGHGEDKRSFDSRRRFVRAHFPDILAAARDPLSNTWWQGAEKPWQALAAAFEIAGALQAVDPASYLSSLPVHMDGSCNGLQHYAALGLDEAGGRAVNLVPADAPQDVYSGVAAIVRARVEADAKAGVPDAVRLRGVAVDRKLVKQTVMTSVYGVTRVGAREQVESRLSERGALDGNRAALFAASAYLANHTLGAIGEMFAGAREIMGWLTACARAVTRYHSAKGGAAAQRAAAQRAAAAAAEQQQQQQAALPAPDGDDGAEGLQQQQQDDEQLQEEDDPWLAAQRKAAARGSSSVTSTTPGPRPVSWTTPLGLPVTQPYFRAATQAVPTVLSTFKVQREDGDRGAPLHARRQVSAFPPNFVHSLDSTHLMMTALRCRAAGVAFAGVHDSYWTHAGTVSAMNALLREEFVALHTRADLLQRLADELRAAHPGIELPPLPARGRLDLSRVRESPYFFS